MTQDSFDFVVGTRKVFHYPAKFGGNMHCNSTDMFLIFNVILQELVTLLGRNIWIIFKPSLLVWSKTLARTSEEKGRWWRNACFCCKSPPWSQHYAKFSGDTYFEKWDKIFQMVTWPHVNHVIKELRKIKDNSRSL